MLSVEFGIERALDHTDGEGTTHHYGLAPVHDFIFEAVERHHLVYHTHLERFGCGVLAAKEPNFACFFLTYASGEVRGAEACVEAAYLWSGLSEAGVVGGYGKVAYHLQDIAAADGIAVDHGYHRLHKRADGLVDVENVEAGSAIGITVSAVSLVVLVAA